MKDSLSVRARLGDPSGVHSHGCDHGKADGQEILIGGQDTVTFRAYFSAARAELGGSQWDPDGPQLRRTGSPVRPSGFGDHRRGGKGYNACSQPGVEGCQRVPAKPRFSSRMVSAAAYGRRCPGDTLSAPARGRRRRTVTRPPRFPGFLANTVRYCRSQGWSLQSERSMDLLEGRECRSCLTCPRLRYARITGLDLALLVSEWSFRIGRLRSETSVLRSPEVQRTADR